MKKYMKNTNPMRKWWMDTKLVVLPASDAGGVVSSPPEEGPSVGVNAVDTEFHQTQVGTKN